MYIGFNLKTKEKDFILGSPEEIKKWEKMGREYNAKVKGNAEKILKKYVNGEVIDGDALAGEWFQVLKSDIFISHSHNDQKLALILAGWLNDRFNLKVFVDEVIWGSADDLLKAFDNQYCRKEDGTYNYNKRNLTTSHVHAMLTTAILKSMDNTEVVLFLNTSNSVPKIENMIQEKVNYTLSPWIYEEIIATNVLRRRDWRTHRITPIYEFTEKLPQIAYKLPLDNIKEISIEELRLWEESYNKSKITRKGRYGRILEKNPDHPLNYLYSTVFGFQD